jgi:hypothetical protein
MIELSLMKVNNALHPDPAYEDEFDRIKGGQWYDCKLTQPRNYLFHKKFFAMIKACHEFQNRIDDFDLFRKVLISESGHVHSFQYQDGRLLLIPKSISFAECDETEFQKIYLNVWQTAMNKFCYEGSEEEIKRRENILMSY